MYHPRLLHELVELQESVRPDAPALTFGRTTLNYQQVADLQNSFANGLHSIGLPRGARVGIYLSKCIESAIAPFGCSKAGLTFVPY